MFINYIHIAIIVLSLAPTVLNVWRRGRTKHTLLNLCITVSAVACAFLLVEPTGIEKFGFQHPVEFLVWLAIVFITALAILILLIIDLKKNSLKIELIVCLLLGILLIATALFEVYYLLLTASLILTAVSVLRFTVFRAK